MSNKLKDMELTSVDLVERGANQRAHIKLFKNDGDHRPAAIDKVVDFFKGLFSDNSLDSEVITKGAAIAECESCLDALSESFRSIINAENEPEPMAELMRKSLGEFSGFMDGAIDRWTMKEYQAAVIPPETNKIEKEGATMEDLSKLTSEEQEQFKKLKAKMSGGDDTADKSDGKKDDEQEKTEKSAGTGNAPIQQGMALFGSDPVATAVKPEWSVAESVQPGVQNEIKLPDSVLKSLKRAEEFMEKSERAEVAQAVKKYEILGEDVEKLTDDLYEMKKSNPDMYDTTIGILDKQVNVLEKSGIFAEIGKSGSGSSVYEGKAEAIAKSLMEKDSSLNINEAMLRAFETHPELIPEYDK